MRDIVEISSEEENEKNNNDSQKKHETVRTLLSTGDIAKPVAPNDTHVCFFFFERREMRNNQTRSA